MNAGQAPVGMQTATPHGRLGSVLGSGKQIAFVGAAMAKIAGRVTHIHVICKPREVQQFSSAPQAVGARNKCAPQMSHASRSS